MSIVKRDDDKYKEIERDEKIEYSEFLYSPPICLLNFQIGYHCGNKIIKGQRTFMIGNGSLHDVYEMCTKCETLKYIKNKIEEFEDSKKKEIKILIDICKYEGKFNIIDKEHYCLKYGEYKAIQFCKI